MSSLSRKIKLGQWFIILVFMLFGAFCGQMSIVLVADEFAGQDTILSTPLAYPVFLIFLYLAFMIQIILHEAGHLLFGLISGYQFSSFRIGSLMFVKKADGIKLKRYKLPGTAGQCLMSPPDMPDEDVPIALYNMGGNIINLGAAILSLLLCLFIKNIPALSLFLSLMSVVGIMLTLMNGIPLHFGAVDNDGYNAISMKKNMAAKHCFLVQMRVNGLITTGMRLKDMPEEWFAMPSNEDIQSGLCAAVGYFALCRALDQMDFERVTSIGYELLEHASGLVGIHKNLTISELLFCELVGKNRKGEINRLYTKNFRKFIKSFRTNISIIRMKYAYDLLANHDHHAADSNLASFEKVAKNYPHESELEGERELISYVNSLYKSRQHQ